MLGNVKVLVSRYDLRGHRGAHVERTVVTAVECVSMDGRSLKPIIIWPASTHRSTWTTFLTPGWHYAYSESGYTDSMLNLEWMKRVFDP
jgi:DDE superfamily endonuclease